jgi:hypothetical protein
LRTCCDCGRQELVRSDNPAERCRSCASRIAGRLGIAVIRARRLRTRCECCGVMFPTTASALASGTVRYCSWACRWRGRRVERRCKLCGTSFTIVRSILSGKTNSSGNFCSRSCYHRYLCRTERVTGRGSRWHAVRKQALRRAPFCSVCGSLQKLDVHHIIPFRITRDNSQPNLIPLCKRHHKLIETIYHDLESTALDLQTLRFWFRNSLTECQLASKSVLKRLARTMICSTT